MQIVSGAVAKQVGQELLRAERLIPWIERGVRVLFIAAAAWLLTQVARRLLGRLRGYAVQSMGRHGDASETEPLLAGLGVAGLAVGLGAQALIKDWLGGVLVLLEDQIRLGDSVTINGISGTVEEINLRTIILRGENGAVHIVSNGLITTISNMTREYAYYVFEATLAYAANVERALALLADEGAAVASEESFGPMILAPIEVMGVERIAERGVVIRARIKTRPAQQARVGRELNRRVSERWLAEGIPFPPVG